MNGSVSQNKQDIPTKSKPHTHPTPTPTRLTATRSPINGRVSLNKKGTVTPGCKPKQAHHPATSTDDTVCQKKHGISSHRCKPEQAQQAASPTCITVSLNKSSTITPVSKNKPKQSAQQHSSISNLVSLTSYRSDQAKTTTSLITATVTLSKPPAPFKNHQTAKTSNNTLHRSCSSTKKPRHRTWQELTRNSDSKLVMMTVEDLGLRRTTRRRKYSKNKPKEEPEAVITKKTEKYESKETVKKTSPVRIASNIMRQPLANNSPNMKSLKRLKPRAVTDIAPRMNNSHQKLQNSPRKSVNFKKLVSKWEQFGNSNLTPAVIKRPRLSDFVDSQSYSVTEKIVKKPDLASVI